MIHSASVGGSRVWRAAAAVMAICFSIFLAGASFAADSVSARAELKKIGVEYSEQQFAKSAGAGDMVAIKLFIDGGMDVNAGGGAALGLAAGRGQIEMVKLLLAKGGSAWC